MRACLTSSLLADNVGAVTGLDPRRYIVMPVAISQCLHVDEKTIRPFDKLRCLNGRPFEQSVRHLGGKASYCSISYPLPALSSGPVLRNP